MASVRLALATVRPADRLGVTRRAVAAVLGMSVLLGSVGVTLAVSTLVADAWTAGLVVLTAVLAGSLLAVNAWRRGLGD